jgi:Cft2 family RNA processing exonuclease
MTSPYSAMALTVLGGAREIGANCYCLELGKTRVLLDVGLHPKRQGVQALPDFSAIRGEVDAIFISHAHLDHIGALPVALKYFPTAPVFTTRTTSLLTMRMLRNAVAVSRLYHDGALGKPLYTQGQVEAVADVMRAQALGKAWELDTRSQPCPPRITFYPAGHVLGAAGILIEYDGRRLFYTGDTCATDQYLCRAAQYPLGSMDTLLLDSTHGADIDSYLTDAQQLFHQATEQLGRFISQVAQKGGSILIPVFALGRAQEIIGVLSHLKERGSIPRLPLFVSGLAHAFCRIYDTLDTEGFRQHSSFTFNKVDYQVLEYRALTPELLKQPCILALSSGMMSPNTSSYILAQWMLPDPKHGVAFVGFLDPDSPGYRLAHAQPGSKIPFGLKRPIEVACAVKQFPFTAHSHASQLVDLVGRLRPGKVVLVHGEAQAVGNLQARLIHHGFNAVVAEQGETINVV